MANKTANKKTQSRRKSSTSTGAKRGRPPKKAAPKKPEVNRLWSILLFVLGLVITAMAFVPGEKFWAYLRENFLFGMFGASGYILGPVLLYIGFRVATGKPSRLKMFWAAGFVLLLSSFIHIWFVGDVSGEGFINQIIELHKIGRTVPLSGGIIAALIGMPLQSVFGSLAARITITLLTVGFFMFLTDTTPYDIYVEMREKAKAEKERLAREMEEQRRERDARRRRRREKARAQATTTGLGRRKRIDFDIDDPVTETEEPEQVKEDVAQSVAVDKEADVKAAVESDVQPLTYDEQSRKQDQLKKIEEIMKKLRSKQKTTPRPAVTAENVMNVIDSQPTAEETSRRQIPTQADEAVSDSVADTLQRGEIPDFWDRPVEDTKFVDMPAYGESHTGPKLTEVTDAYGQAIGVEAEDISRIVDRVFDGPAIDTMATTIENLETAERTPEDIIDVDHDEKVYIYKHPPIDLFAPRIYDGSPDIETELRTNAEKLIDVLASFGVQAHITDISRGPAVTRYELQPATGVKISKITGLADDIALNMAASGVRIEAPIPGKAAVGIEIPNKESDTVEIRGIFETKEFIEAQSPLSVALGVDIAGNPVIMDLARMPHLLIAGSTGSGKSVCVNAIIISFIYKSSPEDVKLVLIDPKMVELAEYNGIPHLMMPVVTDSKKAAGALGGAVAEMEKRYLLFAENSVRDIKSFNKLARSKPELGLEKMPYIAVIIDELADLMMVSGKEVEAYIIRLAQKARAAGIHLIVATQRPSVDVITGLIKANIPARIAFAVSSQVDSRTILDGAGAEKLLGMGDMLFLPLGANKPTRVQGTYVKDEEISAVIDFIKQDFVAEYNQEMIDNMEKMAAKDSPSGGGGDMDDKDEMLPKAIEAVVDAGQASVSLLQRRLKLGYARAARIMDEMEQMGIVGPYEGSKPRRVLISKNEWLEMSLGQND